MLSASQLGNLDGQVKELEHHSDALQTDKKATADCDNDGISPDDQVKELGDRFESLQNDAKETTDEDNNGFDDDNLWDECQSWDRHFALWGTVQRLMNMQHRGEDDTEAFQRELNKVFTIPNQPGEEWQVEHYSERSGVPPSPNQRNQKDSEVPDEWLGWVIFRERNTDKRHLCLVLS